MVRIIKNNWLLLLFLFLDLVVVLAHVLLKNTYGFFNLDGEQNLISTYSGFKLFFIGALALIQFLILRRAGERFSKKLLWVLVASSFLYLGLDELAALHERTGFVLNNLLGVSDSRGTSFYWLLYYSPLILLALLVYIRFIFSVWKENRPAAIFVLIGVSFLVFSLGVEVVSGKVVYPQGILSGNFSLYFVFIIIEEIFELLGSTIFLIGIFKSVAQNFRLHFAYRDEKI